MVEIWKDIEDYPDYQISNFGRVRSLKFCKERILKLYTFKDEYLLTGISKNNNLKFFLVHRLVTKAFIPNPENKPQVNHIDGDKQNNCIYNLEWCSNSENQKHAFKIGLKESRKGGLCNFSKLTNKEVYQIKDLLKYTKYFQKEIGVWFRVSQAAISLINTDKNWSHI